MSKYYNKGQLNCGIAFVLNCPGFWEEKYDLPAAQQTGKNLNILLEFLNQTRPDLFPSTCRYDYTITNSSALTHYKAKTHDTSPSEEEILAPANIARLKQELTGYKLIIFMGDGAKIAKAELEKEKLRGRMIEVPHPGLQYMNSRISKDVAGSMIVPGEEDNTRKRLEVLASRIIPCLPLPRKR